MLLWFTEWLVLTVLTVYCHRMIGYHSTYYILTPNDWFSQYLLYTDTEWLVLTVRNYSRQQSRRDMCMVWDSVLLHWLCTDSHFCLSDSQLQRQQSLVKTPRKAGDLLESGYMSQPRVSMYANALCAVLEDFQVIYQWNFIILGCRDLSVDYYY